MHRALAVLALALGLLGVACSGGDDTGSADAAPLTFAPPDAATRIAAIGPLEGLDATGRAALSPQAFDPVPVPGPTDWLARHPAELQTYEEFVAAGFPRPDGTRRKLYLRPIGPFAERGPNLDRLAWILELYLQLPVERLPVLELEGLDVRARIDPLTGWRQLHASGLTGRLATDVPRDAFWVLGVTMEDLFERTEENFVFGAIARAERVSVQSFLRHDPGLVGDVRAEDAEKLVLTLALKQAIKCAGEAFGIAPCAWFHCALNGSNHQLETSAQPLHLGPVCLRKLHACTGFDWERRYRALARAYAEVGLEGPGAWARARADAIAGE